MFSFVWLYFNVNLLSFSQFLAPLLATIVKKKCQHNTLIIFEQTNSKSLPGILSIPFIVFRREITGFETISSQTIIFWRQIKVYIRKTEKYIRVLGRQGTSSQYQYCYLDLVISYSTNSIQIVRRQCCLTPPPLNFGKLCCHFFLQKNVWNGWLCCMTPIVPPISQLKPLN